MVGLGFRVVVSEFRVMWVGVLGLRRSRFSSWSSEVTACGRWV